MSKSFNSFGQILHAVGVRVRVAGSGTLNLYLRSIDNTSSEQLPSITMQSFNTEPTQLANFVSQNMQVHGEVTAIDETFNICKIVVFVKPEAAEYPR